MKKTIFTLIIAFTTNVLLAQNDGNQNDGNEGKEIISLFKDPKALEKTEQRFDRRISAIGKSLGEYALLKDQKIIYSPFQTRVRKTKEYIELEIYSFISRSFTDSTSIGYRKKSLQLYFTGKSLNKMVTKIYEENFRDKTKTEILINDPSPMDTNTSDISIRSVYNNGDPHEVTVSAMKNDERFPHRIYFKRDFYLPHVDQFEHLYRITKKYQKKYSTNDDAKAIRSLKKSLVY